MRGTEKKGGKVSVSLHSSDPPRSFRVGKGLWGVTVATVVLSDVGV